MGNDPAAARALLTKPCKTVYQSVNLGEIEASMQINEKKWDKSNPLKIKFESQMEFLNKKETKSNKARNFHLYLFEEIPVLVGNLGSGSGKTQIQHTYRPLLDC